MRQPVASPDKGNRMNDTIAVPTTLAVIAAWVLIASLGYSLLYEMWRDLVKAGSTTHDSPKQLLMLIPVLYGPGAVIIWMLLAGIPGATWAGLVFSVVFVLVSVLYYNPVIMIDRKPSLWAWIEDLVYTGLLFVAAALLLLDVAGYTLSSS